MVKVDKSYPFSDSPIPDEDGWRAFFQHMRPNGFLPVPLSSIPVTASYAVSPNAGMVLNVATGQCIINGTFGEITATKTVTIAANASGNPRIDVVVAQLDPVLNQIGVEVITGTPAATPAVPALTQTSAKWEIPIAYIAVANGAASITADNITDRRNIYPGLTTNPANPFVNASLAIWQRGASITPANGEYAADRFITYNRSDIVYSQQASGDYQGSPYCMRVQRPNGNAVTTVTGIHQSCSSTDSLRFAGRLCCYNFRVRRGVGSTATVQAILYSGTGTDQTLGAGLTGQATVGTIGVTPSATWQTVAVTGTPGLTVTQLAQSLAITWSGTAGANDYVEFKDFRCDEGDRPLPHVQLQNGDDWRQCRWYFRRDGGASNMWLAMGTVTAATTGTVYLPQEGPMRAVPTIALGTGAVGSMSINDGSATAVTGIAGNSFNTTSLHGIDITASGGGLTTGRVARVYTTGTVSIDRKADI